jgi:hypothetical protein
VSVLVGLEGDVVKTLQSIKKGIAMLDERRAEVIAEDDGQAPEMWVDEAEDASQPLRS